MASARHGDGIDEPGAAAPRSVDAIIVGAGVRVRFAFGAELARGLGSGDRDGRRRWH